MNLMAVAVFSLFVAIVLGLSFYLARRSQSAKGYFAAGGEIHWSVNGIAFAGDYLSAASFLGICGMIAVAGYDGFLYSIGYLAGWIVALFIVAEPMKRLGKYTFTDALDSKFNSRGIQLAAGISTLIVSIFYLIPQMVGAGVLVTPLLGLPHAVGVIMVGVIVITIVATAGMRSTTYVQFLKGALLVIFSTVVVIALCSRGLSTEPGDGTNKPYQYRTIPMDSAYSHNVVSGFVKRDEDGRTTWWKKKALPDGTAVLTELASICSGADGSVRINGREPGPDEIKMLQLGNLEKIRGKTGPEATLKPVGPLELLAAVGDEESVVRRWNKVGHFSDEGRLVTLFAPTLTPGNKIMRPGMKFKVEGTWLEKLDFVSLMLALFFGTAALPHILIRYYTVRSPACARKSTIVAIAVIGFFYVLTLFMGVGAMVNGVVNPLSNNMSAPLLARSFNSTLFAVISAIAFATVLGTVSGLIVAASGAVAHDLLDRFCDLKFNERQKVVIGKAAALTVGLVAIILGIIFQGMNVSFLVGWAFAVAASANLPAIIMMLFWKKTTAQGIVASILVGTITAVGIILLSPSMYERYGMNPDLAWFKLNQPGIISIPLSFVVLVVVSLLTQKGRNGAVDSPSAP